VLRSDRALRPVDDELVEFELTRFSGHFMPCVQGFEDVQSQTATLDQAVSTILTRCCRAHSGRQSSIDIGKPLPFKEGLTTAEREELVSLRRQMRQVPREFDISKKATAVNPRQGGSKCSHPHNFLAPHCIQWFAICNIFNGRLRERTNLFWH
jgi:hypothetical protein